MTDVPAFDVKPRQQLPQDVATYVRELIISGQVREGEFLRIENIAKRLNISSTPVREGLLQLQSETFVRLVPRRGFVVLGFSKQDVRDIFWTQSVLAGELARRAAQRMTDEEFREIEALDRVYAAAVKDAGPGARAGLAADHQAGHRFHRAINLAARSTRLAMMLGMMVRQLPNRFYGMIEGQVSDTVIYHAQIVEALRARDADRVARLMQEHIAAGGEHLIAHLEAEGMWRTPQDPAGAEGSADPG